MKNTNIQGDVQSKKAYEQPAIEVIYLDETPMLLAESPGSGTPYNDNGYFD